MFMFEGDVYDKEKIFNGNIDKFIFFTLFKHPKQKFPYFI